MLEHARAPVLLTRERLLKELPEHRAEVARIVGCEGDHGHLAPRPLRDLHAGLYGRAEGRNCHAR